MLTVFYAFVAAATAFVILSLVVVRSHEKKQREKSAGESRRCEGGPEPQEEEFFTSPIYLAMEFLAHL